MEEVGFGAIIHLRTYILFIQTSGYSGIDGKVGKEKIQIKGGTSTNLRMTAFAFRTGSAQVTYSFQASQSACCLGSGICGGEFNTYVDLLDTVEVGQVPVGVRELNVNLDSGYDLGMLKT